MRGRATGVPEPPLEGPVRKRRPADAATGRPSRGVDTVRLRRYIAGGYGKVDEGVHAFARLVERLAEEAERGG
ncbi:MAG TPA: hypothetical protein VF009_03875 [Solirubrobacterales bacterium]